MGAMASALGSHIRLLSSRNEHPNSHGIIAKSDVNGVTWTWPNLSPRDIEFNTPKSGWDSSPYASSGSNQFCAIANRGGVVHVDEKCRLQLRFSTTQLAPTYHSTPSNFDIKIPNKSTLSPSAPVFHYAFSSSQNSNIKTKAKVPVQSSLSSTAPVFECWPSMSKSNIATPKISCLSPMAPPFQYAHGDYKISNHTMAALSPSSLAPPKSPKVASSRDIPSNSNFSSNNERCQHYRLHVHFPPY